MDDLKAEKSQKILDAMKSNIESFRKLLPNVSDELTKQNILRSIVLFSCSGIDAVVKQLILESLESVIERDEGAQDRLKIYSEKLLKKETEKDYSLLAKLLLARNSRNTLIDLLKRDLSYDSLQSAEQLFKVASYFNIPTNNLINKKDLEKLKTAFCVRNVIVHQMDVDLHKEEIVVIEHDIDEVNDIYNIITEVSQNFINNVNEMLSKDVTDEYGPIFSIEEGNLILRY